MISQYVRKFKRYPAALLLLLIFHSCSNAQTAMELRFEQMIPVKANEVTAVRISGDGRYVACGIDDGTICLWDINERSLIQTMKYHKKKISCLLFDPDGTYIISSSDDNEIAVWDLKSGALAHAIDDFKGNISCLDISLDGRTLAGCGTGKEIMLWEFPSCFPRGKLTGHTRDVLFVTFSAGGNELLSVGKDRRLIIWDLARLKSIRQIEIDAKTMVNSGIDITSAAASTDKRYIAIGLDEHVLAKGGKEMKFKYDIAFYNWITGTLEKILENNSKAIDFLEISPSRCYVITDNSSLRQHQFSIWNVQTGIIDRNYPIDGFITALDFSDGGDLLAAAFTKNKNQSESFVNLWELPAEPAAYSCFGSTITLSGPGEPLVSSGEPRTIAVIYFDCGGLPPELANLGMAATHFLENKLIASPFVRLIERNQIEAVIKELNYQKSGLTQSQTIEIGKHLGAGYIISGSVDKPGGDLVVTAKLINVQTAQIEGIREVLCKNAANEDIYDMISLMAPAIVKF